MFKIKTIVTMLVIFSLAVLVNGNVYAGGKGATPNGKPFLEINGYIHEIEGEVSSLQDQIDSLVERVDTIEERVGANEQAILDLETMNLSLQAQIDANATDIESVEADIAALNTLNADLQVQIDEFGDATGSLQDQINDNSALITSLTLSLDTLEADLQSQIENNNLLITALQDEINQINDSLALKQMIIDGSCPEGQSIRQINEDGSVVCEVVDAGSGEPGTLLQYRVVNQVNVPSGGLVFLTATCPYDTVLTGGGFFNTAGCELHGSDPVIRFGNGIPGTDSLAYRQWGVGVRNNNTYDTVIFSTAACIKLVP
jgi:peptidoglycan hydrolase CwlO-like protein